MTWEEIGRQYEQDRRRGRAEAKRPKLERNWDNLVRSTDKLVWLFSLSGAGKAPQRSDNPDLT